MLTTKEAAKLLESEDRKITPEQVAELARNGVFPGAIKDERSWWQIPAEDISLYLQVRKRGKRKRFAWITAGTIVTIVTILGLLSITKDTLDLLADYIFPEPTPSPPRCTVSLPQGCLYVFDTPASEDLGAEVLACLPNGAEVEVVGLVPGILTTFYQISSYYYDRGPIVITEIMPNSPAQEIGLQVDDALLYIDDVPLRDTSTLAEYARENAGKTVNLLVRRGGQEITLSVVPRASPPEGQGPIGFTMKGGIIEGGGGYVGTTRVSCIEEIAPEATP